MPSILPPLMKAMMKRERSTTFVNMDPAGQLAALSANGRTTVGADLWVESVDFLAYWLVELVVRVFGPVIA